MDDYLRALQQRGFAWVRGGLQQQEAFDIARALIDLHWWAGGEAPLAVVGEFVLPPPRGVETRDFQTLHFDFGIPVDPKVAQDVGRYTALYVPREIGTVSAVTRLVPLAPLLGQRAWPDPDELLERLVAYGTTHGAWDDERGYVEGSLARLVEAVAGSPSLPGVRAEPGFQCGMEFDSLRSEVHFFQGHALTLEAVEVEVPLSPGELLVFDNLALAHGRRGARQPGELRQRVFGQPELGLAGQRELRDRVLAAFRGSRVGDRSARAA